HTTDRRDRRCMAGDDYHSRPHVNRGDLVEFYRSRREHWSIKRGLLSAPAEEKFSDALDIGTATHLMLLEPERFLSEIGVWDAYTDRGNLKPRMGSDWDKFKKRCAREGRQLILRDRDWWLVAVAGALVRTRLPEII